MKVIWKFELKTTDIQTISVPKEAKILSLQVQKDVPCLWIQVDTRKQPVDRLIKIVGTGHPILTTSDMKFLGTYQLAEGRGVFHVYELVKE